MKRSPITKEELNVLSNIQRVRRKRGKTQKQVAEFLGIHTGSFNYLERGRRKLNFETIVKLSNFLEVPIGEITGSETHEDFKELRKKYEELAHKYIKALE